MRSQIAPAVLDFFGSKDTIRRPAIGFNGFALSLQTSYRLHKQHLRHFPRPPADILLPILELAHRHIDSPDPYRFFISCGIPDTHKPLPSSVDCSCIQPTKHHCDNSCTEFFSPELRPIYFFPAALRIFTAGFHSFSRRIFCRRHASHWGFLSRFHLGRTHLFCSSADCLFACVRTFLFFCPPRRHQPVFANRSVFPVQPLLWCDLFRLTLGVVCLPTEGQSASILLFSCPTVLLPRFGPTSDCFSTDTLNVLALYIAATIGHEPGSAASFVSACFRRSRRLAVPSPLCRFFFAIRQHICASIANLSPRPSLSRM